MPNRPEHTILIADDDRDLVEVLATRCRDLGFGVFTAHDAFSALSLVQSRKPDVVCLDVEMPAGNGLSVREMISSDKQCASIPVIILTGRRDPDTIRRCHTYCSYYVEKCANVWPRVEPILQELFDLSHHDADERSAAPSTQCGSADSSSARD